MEEKTADKRTLTEINFHDIEVEMKKLSNSKKMLSLFEISQNKEGYSFRSTSLDDHFCILLRSKDYKTVLQAKLYLKTCGFEVYGNIDRKGLDSVKRELEMKNLPPEDVDSVMEVTSNYLNFDLKKEEDIGKNKEGDYYFYFYPIKKDVLTWHEFKRRTYLDELNVLAKKSESSIDLIFAQLDNVIYGGLKIPGVAIDEYRDAFFEACNVQVRRTSIRELFIASKILMELVSGEEELRDIGLFQMYMVEEPIFVQYDYEEIYLDFPNELLEEPA